MWLLFLALVGAVVSIAFWRSFANGPPLPPIEGAYLGLSAIVLALLVIVVPGIIVYDWLKRRL